MISPTKNRLRSKSISITDWIAAPCAFFLAIDFLVRHL